MCTVVIYGSYIKFLWLPYRESLLLLIPTVVEDLYCLGITIFCLLVTCRYQISISIKNSNCLAILPMMTHRGRHTHRHTCIHNCAHTHTLAHAHTLTQRKAKINVKANCMKSLGRLYKKQLATFTEQTRIGMTVHAENSSAISPIHKKE